MPAIDEPHDGLQSSFPTSRSYFWLAVAFMAFAIYGSLLPFDLRAESLNSAWDRFRAAVFAAPPPRISRSDLLANALLFLPVGFSLAGSLLLQTKRRFASLRAVATILPLSFAASLIAEFLQTFVARRVPSNVDIAAQTVGCLVGVGAWKLFGVRITKWCRETLAASGEDRLFRVLTAFAFCWIFIQLAPFDITVDVGDLARRVRSGKISIVPFVWSDGAPARHAWDAFAEIVSAVPLGVLGVVRINTNRDGSPAAAFFLGATIVALVEVAQVFISSHSANATDVIFGCAGVGIGVAIGARVVSRARPGAGLSSVVSWPMVTTLAIWFLVLCAYHWLPYDFGVDAEAMKRKLARISLLPFAGYRSGSALKALADLLTKLALSVPLGVGAAFVFRIQMPVRRMLIAGWMLVAACIFGAIEAGQFFLPTRIPDPTDVLVGMAGTYAGLSLGYWLQAGDTFKSRGTARS